MIRFLDSLACNIAATLLLFLLASTANAELNTLSAFNAAKNTQQHVPVIIALDVPASRQANSDRIGEGEWLSLGNYIKEAQLKLANDMGWKNLNELVTYEHAPAMAKTISAQEFRALRANPSVKAVYEDTKLERKLKQSTQQIQLPYALNRNMDGSGVGIAVIDDAVDAKHRFFGGRVIQQACFTSNASCPNGKNRMVGKNAAQPFCDDCNHGTHVAGIAAGRDNNQTGVAPNANIIGIRVFADYNGVTAATSDLMLALDWVAKNHQQYNIKVVNLSLGGRHYSSHCDNTPTKPLIDVLRQKGIATVVASGNEKQTHKIGSPACVSSAISVGALGKQGKIAYYSNSYAQLDIVAPGGDQSGGRDGGIYSSIQNNQYAYYQGTSMATPHVAGAWALLAQAAPKASVSEIEKALTSTPKYTDPRNGVSAAILDLKHALNQLIGAAPKPPTSPQAPPKPKPPTSPKPPEKTQPCSERIDGILIEHEDCKGKMKW